MLFLRTFLGTIATATEWPFRARVPIGQKHHEPRFLADVSFAATFFAAIFFAAIFFAATFVADISGFGEPPFRGHRGLLNLV
jgi:hypothetical protein